MRPPILVGILLAVLIAAGAILAPLFSDSAQKAAEAAQQQASLAQRQLARYDLMFAQLAAWTRADPLDEAALSRTPAEPNTLAAIVAEYGNLSRKAQELAERAGLPAPQLPALKTDAAGIQAASRQFNEALTANEALLKAALDNAKAAARDEVGRNALGVAQALGMAEYARAAALLAEAHVLRMEQARSQARLVSNGTAHKLTQGFLDHFLGLNVAPILGGLQADIDEIRALRAEADAALAKLTQQVTERQQALRAIADELATAQQARLELEQAGSQAGPPDAPDGFAAYRERYQQLIARLQDLQRQEQELRAGTRRGADFEADDPASGALRGGELVIGLEELQRQLATAEERARRLGNAHVSLEEHVKFVQNAGAQAQAGTGQYRDRLAELQAAQPALVDELVKHATAAAEKEAAALTAAENAIKAFGQAQRAAETWFRAVRDLQTRKDPNRKNDRLLLILKDPYFEQVSRSAEAGARVLAGRIHAQRAETCQRLLDDAALFRQLCPDTDVALDVARFEAELTAAREAGIETLEKARELYTTVSEKLANQPTSWVPAGALAAVHDLLGQLDSTRAEPGRAQALELAQKALEKREQSPYTRALAIYRDYLASASAPKPEKLESPEPQEESPKAPEKEEEDFFLDE